MMQLKLDTGTLIIGIVVGVIITAAIGAGVGSADADRFGIAIPPSGTALVKTSDGDFYIVTPGNGMATRVLLRRNYADDPDRSRDSRAWPFGINGPERTGIRPEK